MVDRAVAAIEKKVNKNLFPIWSIAQYPIFSPNGINAALNADNDCHRSKIFDIKSHTIMVNWHILRAYTLSIALF